MDNLNVDISKRSAQAQTRSTLYKVLKTTAEKIITTFDPHFLKKWEQTKRLKGPVVYLIYQMGKVGSSSVANMLRSSPLASSTIHVHDLSKDHFENLKILRASKQDNYSRPLAGSFINETLRRKIDKLDRQTKIRVITGVRDPIARDISALFEIIDHPLVKKSTPDIKWHNYNHGIRLKANHGIFNDNGDVHVGNTLNFLINRFHQYEEDKDYSCQWFDTELKSVFGIDIYNYPFDQTKGYTIIREGHIEILILKVERMREMLSIALNDFFEDDLAFIQSKSNEGDKKKTGADYIQIKNTFRLPMQICKAIYNTRHFRHFYSDDERQALIKQWSTLEAN